jgi:hypothetical protein
MTGLIAAGLLPDKWFARIFYLITCSRGSVVLLHTCMESRRRLALVILDNIICYVLCVGNRRCMSLPHFISAVSLALEVME